MQKSLLVRLLGFSSCCTAESELSTFTCTLQSLGTQRLRLPRETSTSNWADGPSIRQLSKQTEACPKLTSALPCVNCLSLRYLVTAEKVTSISFPPLLASEPVASKPKRFFVLLEEWKRMFKPITARMEEKIRTELDTGRKWNCPLSEKRATIPQAKLNQA